MDARTAKHRAYGIAADLVRQAIATGNWNESVDAAGVIGDIEEDPADQDRVELGLMEIEASLRLRSAPRPRGQADAPCESCAGEKVCDDCCGRHP